jgi:hypothetical protein
MKRPRSGTAKATSGEFSPRAHKLAHGMDTGVGVRRVASNASFDTQSTTSMQSMQSSSSSAGQCTVSYVL